MLRLVLAALTSLPPIPAAYVASAAIGHPEYAPALVAVCRRESRCKPVGIHERDARYSPGGWRSQVRMGHLDRRCQPYRRRGWATRGAFGLNASAHWQFLPACYQPHWLDVPLVSALVAARKYAARCAAARESGWCPRVRRHTARTP